MCTTKTTKNTTLNIFHSMDKFSGRHIDDIFFLFFREKFLAFHANCIKCQNLFSEEKKKHIQNISKCCLLKFIPIMLSVKVPLKCFSKVVADDILFLFSRERTCHFMLIVRYPDDSYEISSIIFSEKKKKKKKIKQK